MDVGIWKQSEWIGDLKNCFWWHVHYLVSIGKRGSTFGCTFSSDRAVWVYVSFFSASLLFASFTFLFDIVVVDSTRIHRAYVSKIS